MIASSWLKQGPSLIRLLRSRSLTSLAATGKNRLEILKRNNEILSNILKFKMYNCRVSHYDLRYCEIIVF